MLLFVFLDARFLNGVVGLGWRTAAEMVLFESTEQAPLFGIIQGRRVLLPSRCSVCFSSADIGGTPPAAPPRSRVHIDIPAARSAQMTVFHEQPFMWRRGVENLHRFFH